MSQIEYAARFPDELYARFEALAGFGLYHTQAWHQVLESTFGWPVGALICERSAGLWVLPLVKKRRLPSLNEIAVALPLSHRVEPLRDAAQEFGRYSAGEVVQALGCPLEIHGLAEDMPGEQQIQFDRTILDLAPHDDESDLLRAFHNASVRRKIKKAARSNVVVSETSRPAHVHAFAKLVAETRQRQGSPTYPGSFLPNVVRYLETKAHLHIAEVDGRVVSGIVFLDDRDDSIYAYGASVDDRSMWQLGINQAAMWHAIQGAMARGKTKIDFGVSPRAKPELRAYKEKWAGVSEPFPTTYVGASRRTSVERGGAAVRAVSNVLRYSPAPMFRAISGPLMRWVL